MNWFLLSLTALLLFVGFILWGVAKVLVIDRRGYARHWRRLRAAPVEEGAIRLVALGDSTFQALGATRPMLGTVGRIASYIEDRTGRAVHIDNVSVTGAKAADVARDQLAFVDMASADIVVIAVGANDALKMSDRAIFERAIEKIVTAVPADKTVMADVAMVRDRDGYQAILSKHRDDAGIYRGNLQHGFRNVQRYRRLSGADFFHPSNYGYELWFAGFQPALDELIDTHSLAK